MARERERGLTKKNLDTFLDFTRKVTDESSHPIGDPSLPLERSKLAVCAAACSLEAALLLHERLLANRDPEEGQ